MGDHSYERDRHLTAVFEVLDEGKNESRLNYAYLALGDCRVSAPHAERKRASVGEPVFIPGGDADASFGLRV